MSNEKILRLDEGTSSGVSGDVVDGVVLSSKQNRDAVLFGFIKTIIEVIPDFLSNVPVVSQQLIRLIDNVNNEVKAQKLSMLLDSFKNRFENQEIALSRLEYIVNSRSGIILFHKITQIIDEGPFDEEWLDLLASVLSRICDENIELQFEERNYILSQIENLSPQALILLNKGEFWKRVQFQGATTMSGQTIVGDWDFQVSRFFAGNLKIEDDGAKMRIAHAFKELEKNEMISIKSDKLLDYTQIGAQVYTYIS